MSNLPKARYWTFLHLFHYLFLFWCSYVWNVVGGGGGRRGGGATQFVQCLGLPKFWFDPRCKVFTLKKSWYVVYQLWQRPLWTARSDHNGTQEWEFSLRPCKDEAFTALWAPCLDHRWHRFATNLTRIYWAVLGTGNWRCNSEHSRQHSQLYILVRKLRQLTNKWNL